VDELFASAMMGVLCRSLAETDPNRVVIFDASPLLATTEAAVLARHMGQTVLVVEANKTPQDTVAQAVAQLDGCANVSLLLNKTTGKDTSGYGYGYGYGADARSDDRERREREAG
jgi:Mrp family chromosome partitioning ATPase